MGDGGADKATQARGAFDRTVASNVRGDHSLPMTQPPSQTRHSSRHSTNPISIVSLSAPCVLSKSVVLDRDKISFRHVGYSFAHEKHAIKPR